ncbi:hypothetical protein [Escherichia coli]|uniref:hypothetical protein n=1 Tax=Escherichia coli TaxID=562 RepID=UPI00039F5370|nr:hypothetical protein [Escherichia coli]
MPDAALTPYPAYVQHVTPRPDKTRQASHPAMSAQFWNRASIKQKIPVTILYILLFSVVQRLCYIREVMTHKEYDFFTAVHRTKGKK